MKSDEKQQALSGDSHTTQDMSNTSAEREVNKESNSEKDENEELVEIKPIEGTPFAAVRQGHDWFLIVGRKRISPSYASEKEVIEDAQDTSWNRLTVVIAETVELTIKEMIKKGEIKGE